jgi:threonine/homoserine/homoserine lactone efflux protein
MFATTLGEAIGSFLPSAVAVAISPIPIIAVVVMLGTPRARVTGTAFAVGWIVGLGIATTAVVVLASGLGAGDPGDGAARGSGGFQIALGVGLLFLALKQWRKRPAAGEDAEMPGWMNSVDHFGAAKAAGLGVVLSAVNPKNLILAMSAGAAIAQAALSDGQDVIAIAVFVAIGSVTVVGAVLVNLVAGRRAESALASVKSFMATHNSVIMAVLLLLIGAKVLGQGIAGLSA